MRDRFTTIVGLLAIASGVLWMLDLATDLDVPWEWVLPVALVALGAVLVIGHRPGGGPPSQFERDDAPRVP